MRRMLWLTLWCAAAITRVLAQAPETKVSLIAEQNPAKSGSAMLAGIRFRVPAGWHIYWVNPGDAGQPPSVQWSLPAGWSAGELQWPTPMRLTNPAGVDYGYEGEVTLLTAMKVGGAGGDVTANLRWLVCKDVCVPQKGTAKTSVRTSNTAGDSPEKEAIAVARGKLPKALPPQWKANALQNPKQVLLNFRPGIRVQQASFFPRERDVIENAAPQKLSSTSYAAQLALPKAEVKKAAKLKGVLVVNGADAYTVDVPVK